MTSGRVLRAGRCGIRGHGRLIFWLKAFTQQVGTAIPSPAT